MNRPPAAGARFRLATVALLLWAGCAWSADAPHATLLMLEFELIDEARPGDSAPPPAERRRLALISEQLRAEVEAGGIYDVVDPGPAAAAIERARASHHYLHDCNGCELDLAREAGAERVLTGWVQKVSELILNLNIEIKDVATGKPVARKSVDIRGNTDRTWSRGIAFLVREMREKGRL